MSPKATNKITPNLSNVIWVGRKKIKLIQYKASTSTELC